MPTIDEIHRVPVQEQESGLNDDSIALLKCRTGKKSATRVSHSGASAVSMKTPEMNNRGRIEKFTIAGAASALGTTDVMASPSAENVAAPTSTVRR